MNYFIENQLTKNGLKYYKYSRLINSATTYCYDVLYNDTMFELYFDRESETFIVYNDCILYAKYYKRFSSVIKFIMKEDSK